MDDIGCDLGGQRSNTRNSSFLLWGNVSRRIWERHASLGQFSRASAQSAVLCVHTNQLSAPTRLPEERKTLSPQGVEPCKKSFPSEIRPDTQSRTSKKGLNSSLHSIAHNKQNKVAMQLRRFLYARSKLLRKLGTWQICTLMSTMPLYCASICVVVLLNELSSK